MLKLQCYLESSCLSLKPWLKTLVNTAPGQTPMTKITQKPTCLGLPSSSSISLCEFFTDQFQFKYSQYHSSYSCLCKSTIISSIQFTLQSACGRFKVNLAPLLYCTERSPFRALVTSSSWQSSIDAQSDFCYLEHVQVWLNSRLLRRPKTDYTITLESPQGTKSILIDKKAGTKISQYVTEKWIFKTLHSWGENPSGNWTLKVTVPDGRKYEVVAKKSLYITATSNDCKYMLLFVLQAGIVILIGFVAAKRLYQCS